MNSDLDSLEHKVDQVLALCGDLNAENLSLRARVSALEHDNQSLESANQSLSSRMETARSRLEALLPNLPEE